MLSALDDPHTLAAAVDTVVADVLDRARTIEPPVDAIAVARQLGITVAFDRDQTARGRTKRLRGRPTILLRPDERPERVQWAAAHELGELQTGAVLQTAGTGVEDLEPDERERLANLFANRLLLPTSWFFDDLTDRDCDLLAMKERYCTASHELIALRMLDGDRPLVVTVFDNDRLTRRVANTGRHPGRPMTGETTCRREVRNSVAPAVVRSDEYTVHGWPLYENAWQREILLTRPVEIGDDV